MENSYSPSVASSRRRFLKKTLAGAGFAALPVASPAKGSLDLLSSAENSEVYWEQVRQQFGLRPGLILMNAANLCPSPRAVSEAVASGTQDLDFDASFHNRKKFGDLRTELRQKLASYLNVAVDEITLTRNTSESNNTIVQGLPLKQGDEVVLWDQNHPTNLLAWQVQAKRQGFTVKVISTPENPSSSQELIKPFLEAFTPQTRLISFSHISNTTGVAMPDELCKVAREQGIMSMVDGAQSFGSQSLDLQSLDCDFYTSSAHKWFMGPREMGILHVRKSLIPELWPHIIAAGYDKYDQTDIERLSSLGQQDTAKLSAFIKAIEFHEAIGKEKVAQRITDLASLLKEQVQNRFPQAKLITPVAEEVSGGVVIVQFPDQDHSTIFNQLYEQYQIACAPTGGLRFSPTIYNTSEEVGRVMDALATLVS